MGRLSSLSDRLSLYSISVNIYINIYISLSIFVGKMSLSEWTDLRVKLDTKWGYSVIEDDAYCCLEMPKFVSAVIEAVAVQEKKATGQDVIETEKMEQGGES